MPKDLNSKNSKTYLPRDISWMYFNHRILQEAQKEQVPLLERLSFLGIYSNNLDEFFRVRVASQNRVAECEDKEAKTDREEAIYILKEINKLNAAYSKEFEKTIKSINQKLREENIYLLQEDELDEEQRAFIKDFYYQKLCGYVLPTWFPATKQLKSSTDESIYLAVKMRRKDLSSKKAEYAFLELPVSISGRFVRLNDKDGKCYLTYLDDVIRCCLPLIFSGQNYTDFEAYSFKFTRDAEMEIDNDLRNGMLQKISKGVKSRKKGAPMRIVYDAAMPKVLLKHIMNTLYVDKLDTVLAGGRYQNHKDLMKFPDCGRKDLKYPAWPPILKKELASPEESILELIRQKDRYIHVPYHSFDSYLRVLQEAAINREVKSIKTTLYRLAKDSKVIEALIAAAHNGKKVTVIIELLARFDEASNIVWSKKMQDAGIEVIFGVEGLKVHSKITLIHMKSGADLACISSGNFHEGNARMYTDFMLMTASRPIVKDVENVFNFIEKPYTMIKFKELLVSPNEMKQKFIRLINEEIKNKKAGKEAYIKVKINHITDELMVKKLYEAAEAGVQVDLLVRGNCSLKPNLKSLNGNMKVVGIIDRYLEHARIFIFAAGGLNKTFLGSADWMPRNLDHRVEVITPVYDEDIKANLRKVVEYGLKDTLQGRIVDGLGTNLENTGDEAFRSQETLYREYLEENQNEK
ncbi:RNA degradosome polyphosphate kinase [Bacteroides sp. OF04-15BH]|jgi:polyphosphate kinase|uniref:RNA degradosome polyphosphate kinase n=1 Tax=Bacteroides sp. OF04-15BH TaxID=2292281 RepID=UPI000E4F0679|nr:RNA degradosome polyphosphate kinase [Bacteroides sp. OF04-15BH]RHP61853.1 RNA degradosome polyphosphate kinase [Bacteroides sp. OF04-15BH]